MKKEKVTAMGRSRRHHITGDVAPVYGLSTVLANGDVVELPDGSHAYVYADAAGEIGLYRDMLAMDYGDNILRRNIAPASTRGIAAQGAARVRVVGDRLVGWVSGDD